MPEEIPGSVLVMLGDHSPRMGATIVEKLVAMLREEIPCGTQRIIRIGGIVLVDDREHLGKNMNPIFPRNSQHPVPVLKHPKPLIEKPHFFQNLTPHEWSTSPMKTLRIMQLPAPVRGILSGKLTPGAILADEKMARSTKAYLGMLLKKKNLFGQLTWEPLVIGVK
jgi:hypothetical protein